MILKDSNSATNTTQYTLHDESATLNTTYTTEDGASGATINTGATTQCDTENATVHTSMIPDYRHVILNVTHTEYYSTLNIVAH